MINNRLQGIIGEKREKLPLSGTNIEWELGSCWKELQWMKKTIAEAILLQTNYNLFENWDAKECDWSRGGFLVATTDQHRWTFELGYCEDWRIMDLWLWPNSNSLDFLKDYWISIKEKDKIDYIKMNQQLIILTVHVKVKKKFEIIERNFYNCEYRGWDGEGEKYLV